MRYLKKYNESKDDIVYLHQIFADLIEDYGAKHVKIPPQYNTHSYYEISIPEISIKNSPRENGVSRNLDEYLDSYIEKTEKVVKLCNEIKSCINRIRDSFPNVKIEYSVIVNSDTNRRDIRLEIYDFDK